jgi:threonine dehydrogenase-like Zn-dependent dehydrogenase
MRTIYLEKNIPKALLIKALRPLWPGVVFTALSPTLDVTLPDLPLPGPRFVRLRNRLCGVCASDLHLLNVEADPQVAPVALPGNARVYLGHEVVSDVIEVGSSVTSLKVGDRVIMDAEAANCLNQEIDPPCRHCREGNTALCENASLGQGAQGLGGGWGDGYIAHETTVHRVPDALDDDMAALIEPLAVGVRAALRRLPGSGGKALVVGSGIIGLAVVQALRALAPHCQITAMARYPQQVEMARRLGADEVLAGGDPYTAVARATGARLYKGMFSNRMLLGGYDVVYDCVGSQKTLQDGLRWARAGGAVVLAGIRFEPIRVDLTPIWYQEVDLLGLYAHGMERWNGQPQSTYDLTIQLLLEGKLETEGLITHRYPLEQWRTAVRTAMNKRSGAIKVVLDYRSERR